MDPTESLPETLLFAGSFTFAVPSSAFPGELFNEAGAGGLPVDWSITREKDGDI